MRLRAREAGIDLRQVRGSGPAGRITHEDLDAFTRGGVAAGPPQRRHEVEEIRIIGLRRRIAERMRLAKDRIPHITYVEEIDVTALEDLRGKLNAKGSGRVRLTLLPFLVRALVKAVEEQPLVNALYDDEAGILRRYGAVHAGIATQTPGGLMVPVVRHAEALGLRDCAEELARVTAAARDGTAKHETHRLHHHYHLPGRARWHRLDADHQSPGSGNRRGQQDRGTPALGRSGLRAAQDVEPLLQLRSSGDRRLERRPLCSG